MRIEKQGNNFRFLYAGGELENGAFKELASREIDMQPKYIGIFAIKAFTDAKTIPVTVRLFNLSTYIRR